MTAIIHELQPTNQLSSYGTVSGSAKTLRFEELDSLRGVAALVVFIYHCIFLLAVYPPWVKLITLSPLAVLLFGGHQAVILFFVLSGFVLYLPYSGLGRQNHYGKFVIRRICRIYLPYLCSVLFIFGAYLAFFNPRVPPGLSELYGWRILSRHQMLVLFRDFVLFVGFFKRDYLNGPTWTLAEEMRISFIFPLIAVAIARLKASTSICLAVLCSSAVSVGIIFTHHRSPLETIHYACLFALGAVLARNLRSLCATWRGRSVGMKTTMLCVSVLVCSYAQIIQTRVPTILREEPADWLIALSVSVFLVSSLAEPKFGRLLRHPAMLHCGRTSYGIYLLHLPILFVCVNLLWSRIAHPLVFAVALAVTLLAAHVLYRFIELPSIALGKRLTSRNENSSREENNAPGVIVLLDKAHRAYSKS